MNKKILDFTALAVKVQAARKIGKRIVLCHGCFDLMHPGHIKHFEEARRAGDILVVTVTPDKYIDKGPGKPVYTERLRLDSIAALSCVDYVSLNKWPTAEQTLRTLKPHLYAKGAEFEKKPDQTGKLQVEQRILKEYGGKLLYTHDPVVFSSTRLLNDFFGVYPEHLMASIRELKKDWDLDRIMTVLEQVRKLRVLVIGETIIDEYISCEALERASKSHTVATRYLKTDAGVGGALCVANHLSQFCDRVSVATFLGDHDSWRDYIDTKLSQNIRRRYFVKRKSPTIVKRRYIDSSFMHKIFEIHRINDDFDPAMEKEIAAYLEKNLGSFDIVMVADFGHGLFSPRLIKLLCNQAPFLTMTVQTNSGNLGFNYFSRYRKADYLSIDERELRLGSHEKHLPIREIFTKKNLLNQYRTIAVTLGRKGSTLFGRRGSSELGIVTDRVVDTIGAGDAFYALTTPLVYLKTDPRLALLFGNVAGAIAANIVGNNEYIRKNNFLKLITSFMK